MGAGIASYGTQSNDLADRRIVANAVHIVFEPMYRLLSLTFTLKQHSNEITTAQT